MVRANKKSDPPTRNKTLPYAVTMETIVFRMIVEKKIPNDPKTNTRKRLYPKIMSTSVGATPPNKNTKLYIGRLDNMSSSR